MNKIALSVLALAALSSVSFASQRGYDLADAQFYATGIPTISSASASVDTAPLAVVKAGHGVSNFDRLTAQSTLNDMGLGH